MKILVTGGAGFIGSHVVELLLSRGYDVVVVDDLSTGHERNVPRGAIFRRLDIRSEDFTRLLLDLRPQAVFHFAAQMDVRHSVVDPIHDAEINVLGMVRLLDGAAQAGCAKVIFSSTGGAIYGEQEVFPAPEGHPCAPLSPYGTSKLCGEVYLSYFQRAGGPRFVSLRYANVYGPRQDPHGEAGVVAIFARKMLSGETPTIFGDGCQSRDFVYVEDVARANLLALEQDATGLFNIGTGLETDINTIYRIIAGHTGCSAAPDFAAAKAGEQKRSAVDPARATRVLGWHPQVGLAEGLGKTVSFFRDHPEY